MLEILATWTLTEIVVGIVIGAIIIKESFTFFEWVSNKFKKKFSKENENNQAMQQVEIRFEKDEERVESLAKEHIQFHQGISDINTNLTLIQTALMNDIRAWITDKHHIFTEQEWIDVHSLECIEQRYSDYRVFGGNSFVGDLMEEIRQLPTHPPED